MTYLKSPHKLTSQAGLNSRLLNSTGPVFVFPYSGTFRLLHQASPSDTRSF